MLGSFDEYLRRRNEERGAKHRALQSLPTALGSENGQTAYTAFCDACKLLVDDNGKLRPDAYLYIAERDISIMGALVEQWHKECR